MCGIVGLWSHSLPAARRRSLVANMLSKLADRGPDCATIVDHGSLSLGFCRLTIVGAPGLVQPVRYGTTLSVVNGEIFNYKQLWRDLPPAVTGGTVPTSDAAVVAPLAAWHGPSFVSRLDGAFAGVVVDLAADSLVLFRDQVGVKPLFYTGFAGGLAFASTAAALTPVVEKRVNYKVLRHYLANGYAQGDDALLASVKRMPAGCLASFPSPTSTPRLTRWFTTEPAPDRTELRSLLTKAVISEIPDSGPVVTALSGGVDSTLITTLITSTGVKPVAVTVRYPGSDVGSDVSTARLVARDLGLCLEEVTVTEHDYLSEVEGGWRFDQPLADPNAIALNRLCRRTKDVGSRVLIAGDGSDELFGGYPYYHEVANKAVRSRLAAWRFTSMSDDHDRMFVRIVTGRRARRPFRPSLRHPLRIALERDQHGWLEANLLEKADRFGMADQVEIRVPFLRPALVRLAAGLPPEDTVGRPGGAGKVALRAAFSDVLPEYVLTRRKQGFPCPLSEWLRGSLGRELYAQATWAVCGAWDIKAERRLWDKHVKGEGDWGQQLWRLALLRSWWRSL